MFNVFVFCLRIVYANHFSYIDEYHQVKTTYSLKGDNISRKLYFPYRTRQTIRAHPDFSVADLHRPA